MCSDLAQRKLHECPIIFCALLLMCIASKLVSTEQSTLMEIQRRLSGDFAYYKLNSRLACNEETFVTDERQCVSNEDLLNGIINLIIYFVCLKNDTIIKIL